MLSNCQVLGVIGSRMIKPLRQRPGSLLKVREIKDAYGHIPYVVKRERCYFLAKYLSEELVS